MSNYIDYLGRRGDLSFCELPFNEVDNLLLSQVAYVDFEGIVEGVDSECTISFRDAAKHLQGKYSENDLKEMTVIEREWTTAFFEMSKTRRFGDCYLSKYVNKISIPLESQFCAVKIDMDGGESYVAYSGTDTSLIGWKENFNMCFLKQTPGQKLAVKYLNAVATSCKGDIRVGGHSKGGNLAVYAAMHTSRSIQDRIRHIYNNDGPGFTPKMIIKSSYRRICKRIHTYVPQSSIVGMLLEHEENVEIISSSNMGFLQHDAISWEILGDSFIRQKERNNFCLKIDKAMKIWVDSMNDDERRLLIDTVFSILKSAKIYNLETLIKMKPTHLMEVLKAANRLNTDNKNNLKNKVRLFIDIWFTIQDTNFF